METEPEMTTETEPAPPTIEILCGDNLELLEEIDDCAADSIVTDPPYGLGFMGKDWDRALPDPKVWSECLRVLKPGGHLVAFGAPRLVHRLTCQIEDAGFEIRDQLLWLYGSGFPKSLDVRKAADDEAWSGWGTALKPAYEPIVLARKPLDGTVAANVLTHGTGALNIDGCRIPAPDPEGYAAKGASVVGLGSARNTTTYGAYNAPREDSTSPLGRWPANLILDEAAGAMLDAQSGVTKSRQGKPRKGASGMGYGMTYTGAEYSDSGGASRYFYCPKASRAEREAGLNHLPPRIVDSSRADGAAARDSPRTGAGRKGDGRRNHHATVKPIELMRWLVRLVTPPGGIVLDPFLGSGSTLVACALEGFHGCGMEVDPEYIAISEGRVAYAQQQRAKEKP